MPPPYPRFDKLPEDKQAAILTAAREEFLERGYDDASLNQIIAAAGISKGSFYYYFEDKADLFVAVVDDLLDFDALIEGSGLLASANRASFWGAMDQMVEASFEVVEQRPELIRIGQVMHRMPESARGSGAMVEFFEGVAARVSAILAHGQKVGAIRDDMPLELMTQLWMNVDRTFDNWALEFWDEADEATRRVMTGVAMGIFRRIFAPDDKQ